jgi:hypothetical protein
MNTSSPSPEPPKTFVYQLIENGQGKEEDLREVLPGIGLQNLLSQRDVVQQIRQALDLLGQAENTAGQMCMGFPDLSVGSLYRRHAVAVAGRFADRATAEAAMIEAVDGSGWKFLMEASGLRAFMSGNMRDKWVGALSSGDFPELGMPAITAVFGKLHAEREAMIEQGVLECFHRLSWDHSARLPRQLGEKIIVHDLIQNGSVQLHATNTLDELERVSCLLDGKPESVQHGKLHSVMHSARRANQDEAETGYLRLRWYQNGNGRITFKRCDLVEKMNAILTAHEPDALPATTGKRAKR